MTKFTTEKSFGNQIIFRIFAIQFLYYDFIQICFSN